MEERNRNYLSIWKILGVVEYDKQPNLTNEGNIKVLCPYHEDTTESLALDKTNDAVKGLRGDYPSGRCWACQDKIGNVTPSRFLMSEFHKTDNNDTEAWKRTSNFINTILEWEDVAKINAGILATSIRSTNIEHVKSAVLKIFKEELLDEHNPDWVEELQILIDNGDLTVTKQNEFAQEWTLTFSVGYGKDIKIGEVKYHPNSQVSKTSTTKGTKNGIFMPFYFKPEIEFSNNNNKNYITNLIANPAKRIIIVEGQKDMLALRLLGIPAITITGGAGQLAANPEIFTNKEVFIIYDNDVAGFEGAEKLGIQLAEYADKVHIATGFYKDLKEKEDAFDFLFVYGDSDPASYNPGEFVRRLQDIKNFKTLDADKILELQKEAEDKKQKQQLMFKAKKVKSFNDTYDLPMHTLFEINARVDAVDAQASHNIYTKVYYKLDNLDNGDNEDVRREWNKILAVVEKAKTIKGLEHLVFEVANEKQIVVSTRITEDHMDIVERILIETNKNTDSIYLDLFESIHLTINRIRTSKADIKHYINLKLDYDKDFATDYTEMWISQDLDFEELSQDGGASSQVYSVFMPSSQIKSNTKIGDKITLIVGKLKKHRDNKPFLLGYSLVYRDPIANFELTEEKKASLAKFRFDDSDGATQENFEKHIDKLYYGMRLMGPEAQVYSKKMFTAIELTYNSIRYFIQEDIMGNKHPSRGVLDIALIGDSGTGKSKTIERFIDVYGVGIKQEVQQTTERGLLGGSDIGNKNKIVPGLLPQHDKALVTLEELSGAEREKRVNIYKAMLELRSTGKYLLSRVSDKVEVTTDVRLIATSNPINVNGEVAQTLDGFRGASFWEAIELLIPNIAALNRFSFVHFPTLEELENSPSHSEIAKNYPDGNLPFTRQDWKTKIQWVWSRREENTIVSAEIDKYLNKRIKEKVEPVLKIDKTELGFYSVGRSNFHIKNIAVAFAAMTVSTIDFENVIVKKIHVDAAINFLLSMYHEETNIPEKVRKLNKELSATDSEINMLLGSEKIDDHSTTFTELLTFKNGVPAAVKGNLFDMYSELYNLSTGSSGSHRISWKLLEPYFVAISMSALNNGHSVDERGVQVMGAWKLAMKKIGLIKEHPTQDRIFVLQPKFLDMYPQIKEHYYKDKNGGD